MNIKQNCEDIKQIEYIKINKEYVIDSTIKALSDIDIKK